VPADERTEREDAREIVRAILNDGPMETAEFIKLTRNAGMSDRTVERARRDLGVRATSTHDGRRIVGWKLALPDKSTPTPPPTPPLPDRGALGGLGGVALNRGDVNRPRIKTANPANPAEGTLAGGVEPFFDRDEF